MSLVGFLEDHLLPCSIKSLTGLDCPGCGMQRAFVALLKGDLASSLQYHPALIPFLFTMIFTGFHLWFNFRNGARVMVSLFAFTCSLMIVNFIVKLLSHQ